jgi:hypothetical protein
MSGIGDPMVNASCLKRVSTNGVLFFEDVTGVAMASYETWV